MTEQQLNYAYWQRLRQQQLYKMYKAAAAGNSTPPPPTVYYKIAFAMSGGHGKFICDGEDVSVSGKYVQQGGSATIQVVPSPGYAFVKWGDDESAPNPRTFSNVQEDIAVEAIMETTKVTAGTWTYTDSSGIHRYDRYPDSRDNWEFRKPNGTHDALNYVLFDDGTGYWKYGEAGQQYYSDSKDRDAKTFNVTIGERKLTFNWTPTIECIVLKVIAMKDGERLESDDIELKNLRYDEDDPRHTLAFNVQMTYPKDTELTLKPVQKDGTSYRFDSWADGYETQERSITMNQAYELSANFRELR